MCLGNKLTWEPNIIFVSKKCVYLFVLKKTITHLILKQKCLLRLNSLRCLIVYVFGEILTKKQNNKNY